MELEHLLSKVLVIDRTTVHVVNSTWQPGWIGSRAEVVGVCCFTCNLQESTVQSKTFVCSCKKTRLRKGYDTQRCFEWCSLTVY